MVAAQMSIAALPNWLWILIEFLNVFRGIVVDLSRSCDTQTPEYRELTDLQDNDLVDELTDPSLTHLFFCMSRGG